MSDADFERFDLILAMDRLNYVTLVDRAPEEFRERIRLFMEFAADRDVDDVPDPYYGGPPGFEQVLDLAEEAAAGLLDEVTRQIEARRRR